MVLLITYVIVAIIGQAIAFSIGALVDQYSPGTGILVFFPLFAIGFWLAWVISVRITEPRSADSTAA